MTRLDDIIATAKNGEDEVIRLFELYTQASSRLSRLLRDRRALSGEAADGIAGAIAQAMDELGTELGRSNSDPPAPSTESAWISSGPSWASSVTRSPGPGEQRLRQTIQRRRQRSPQRRSLPLRRRLGLVDGAAPRPPRAPDQMAHRPSRRSPGRRGHTRGTGGLGPGP